MTWTSPDTHRLLRESIDRSPLYAGVITGVGARYCPSLEDKVMRFAEKERHQVLLEPEGRDTEEIYAKGLGNCLPLDVQAALVRSVPGLEQAEIMRPAYAVEYDFVQPTQLAPTLETKAVGGLFLAGQVNGTSGYEEAAAQGLWAGINAACLAQARPPFVLDRSEAYLGVLVDDLVTRGTREPYRMFTSRAEWRLLLREDNADLRLRERGRDLGLVGDDAYARYCARRDAIAAELERVRRTRLAPTAAVNARLRELGTAPLAEPATIWALLHRPGLGVARALPAAGRGAGASRRRRFPGRGAGPLRGLHLPRRGRGGALSRAGGAAHPAGDGLRDDPRALDGGAPEAGRGAPRVARAGRARRGGHAGGGVDPGGVAEREGAGVGVRRFAARAGGLPLASGSRSEATSAPRSSTAAE